MLWWWCLLVKKMEVWCDVPRLHSSVCVEQNVFVVFLCNDWEEGNSLTELSIWGTDEYGSLGKGYKLAITNLRNYIHTQCECEYIRMLLSVCIEVLGYPFVKPISVIFSDKTIIIQALFDSRTKILHWHVTYDTFFCIFFRLWIVFWIRSPRFQSISHCRYWLHIPHSLASMWHCTSYREITRA